MPKALLLLRHAKSSWSEGHAQSDHDRPLNDRGRRAAPRMGRLILEQGLMPDFVMTSTARRALETTDAVVAACGYHGVVERVARLYLAPAQGIIELLGALEQDVTRPLVVGHNPGMEELVSLLCGWHEHMSTAALASLELPIDAWSELDLSTQGRLVNVWRPKALDSATDRP